MTDKAAAKKEQADAWRAKHEITAFGELPSPIESFQSSKLANLPEEVVASFDRQGFTAPTPIQAQSWPVLLKGHDFIGIAKTGSGKTLAFIVPAIQHITNLGVEKRPKGPVCCVLAPTRELSQQIQAETEKVLPPNIRSLVVYGGVPKDSQIAALNKGVHILIATPGRLLDLCESEYTTLSTVSFFVLDEADRMLDMGFEPDVRRIVAQIPKQRQTVMFSATWPETVQALAAAFQSPDAGRIHVGATDLHANSDVTQHFIFVKHAGQKIHQLYSLLDYYKGKRILVFVLYKKSAHFLETDLKKYYGNVVGVHSDKTQQQREAMLQKFRRDKDCILVATDVAARGLDVKELDVVINYEFVLQVDDYVHRIGRTGRAGAKGDAYTIVADREDYLDGFAARELTEILKGVNQEVPKQLQAIADTVKNRVKPQKAKKEKIPEAPSLEAVSSSGAAKVMKFADSDDDDEPPMKKSKTEKQ